MTEAPAPWIDLGGRVAAVTGAASGIGRAAALALAGAGAAVLALDLDAAGARVTADQAGGEALALDVTDPAQWDAAREHIQARWGRLDILVNSAGVVASDRVGDPDLGAFRRIFAVNVEGSLLGMETALGFMRAAGRGAIVNVASAASLRGASTMASYGASKAAIAHYSRSAALEVVRAGHDIRINSIHPGVIETAMAEQFYGIYGKLGPPEKVVAAMTTGRTGRPEEVADLILFLCSDRASYISGTQIVIDRASNA